MTKSTKRAKKQPREPKKQPREPHREVTEAILSAAAILVDHDFSVALTARLLHVGRSTLRLKLMEMQRSATERAVQEAQAVVPILADENEGLDFEFDFELEEDDGYQSEHDVEPPSVHEENAEMEDAEMELTGMELTEMEFAEMELADGEADLDEVCDRLGLDSMVAELETVYEDDDDDDCASRRPRPRDDWENPAQALLAAQESGDSYVTTLMFPDPAMPCERFHQPVRRCYNRTCTQQHEGSSTVSLFWFMQQAKSTVDICVHLITSPLVSAYLDASPLMPAID